MVSDNFIITKRATFSAEELPPRHNLFGDIMEEPIISKIPSKILKELYHEKPKELGNVLKRLARKQKKYLDLDITPPFWNVEGVEEFPCLMRYDGGIPETIYGIDEVLPDNSGNAAVHFCCYDHVIGERFSHPGLVVQKCARALCAFGPDFSIPLDARRCDQVAAIRLNRITTLFLQMNGVQTIQTATYGNANSLSFCFDGLAEGCPTVVENNLTLSDPSRIKLQRLAIKRLVEQKHPSILLVVGFPLTFDPGVPVKVYESRIQKLRRFYA